MWVPTVLGALLLPAVLAGTSFADEREWPHVPARCLTTVQPEEISEPWAGLALDPEADPTALGYVELLRFRTDAGDTRGRAMAFKVSDYPPEARNPEYPRWNRVLIVEFDGSRDALRALFDEEPDRPGVVFYYRHPHMGYDVRLESRDDGTSVGRLCRVLGELGLARVVEITGRASARTGSARRLFRRYVYGHGCR